MSAVLEAKPPATSPTRVRILTEIAERYHELVDPLSRTGVAGDGNMAGLLRMPSTYTETVREFERLACRLRDEDRELWRHLDGWWLSAQVRTVFHCPRCGITHQPAHVHQSRRHGRTIRVECKRVRRWRRLPGAQEGQAKAAIMVIASWWALASEPMLPEEIRIR